MGNKLCNIHLCGSNGTELQPAFPMMLNIDTTIATEHEYLKMTRNVKSVQANLFQIRSLA